jgi:drug/metabolite transporter (DMT)-like permease
MDPSAAVLMLIAGVLHASWHAIVKTGRSLAILAGMGLVSSIVTLPFLFVVPLPPGSVWPILLLSVALHGAYKLSLSRAYASADFSNAYPLARGLVPLFAVALSYVWLDQLPGAGQCWAIIAIVCGVVGLVVEQAMSSFMSSLQPRVLLAALCAGLTVAAYSVVDAWGVRAGAGWSSFTAWLIVIDSLAFFALARLVEGRSLWSAWADARGQTVVAGLLGVTAFAVFIWALSANPVASVTAFRECSVLFGALIGMTLLRERFTPRKLACVCLIAAGLVGIAVLK